MGFIVSILGPSPGLTPCPGFNDSFHLEDRILALLGISQRCSETHALFAEEGHIYFHSSDDSDTLMPDGLSYKDPTSFLGSTTFSIPSLSKLWVRIFLIELSTLWVREVLSY